VSEAINAYRTVTTPAEHRELERLREKAKHDEAQALLAAELRGEARGKAIGISTGKAEVTQNLIRMGMSIRQVAEATGLTQREVETIQRASYLS